MTNTSSAKSKRRNRKQQLATGTPYRLMRLGSKFIQDKPHFVALMIGVLYLLIFQFPFISSGDAWAEAFYEYVHGAMVDQWQGFFTPGIAGYYNFLPKLLSYPYVILGFPLDRVDYFFRMGVITFTILCTSFIAHPSNRSILKNDWLRIGLATAVLMSLTHVSSFSMINIWYVGFIPMIMVSLSARPFKNELEQILYAGFALAVCLSKPSLIMAPLVIYRIWKHREYLLGSIILFGITLQSLLFLSSPFYDSLPTLPHTSMLSKLSSLMLYPGLMLLKALHIYPSNIGYVYVATLVLIGCVFICWKRLGVIMTTALALTAGLVVYSAIFPPDSPLPPVLHSYTYIYGDFMKLQRDVLVYFIILFALFFLLGALIDENKLQRFRPRLLVTVVVVVLFISLYRPIGVTNAASYINIDSFRPTLHNRTVTCMPIAPSPSWLPAGTSPISISGWYYESNIYGTCGKVNYGKKFDRRNFDQPLDDPLPLSVRPERALPIRALLIPIESNPSTASPLWLKNIATGKVYTAHIVPRGNNERLSYVAFNLDGEAPQEVFHYQLTAPAPLQKQMKTARFNDGGTVFLAYYSTI